MPSEPRPAKWVFTAGSANRQRVLELAKKIAPSSCPVLILGPTGVGKEVLAEDIHAHSERITGRFVALNCASLTPSLFESELFGHHRGAYTGAQAHKLGLVELADRGTLFLDEVSELPIELQAKLLRFLARGTFWPLGATEERSADVRVIAAANRDLRKMIPHEFREDLYHRLSVMPIILAPLEAEDTRLICIDLADEVARRTNHSTSGRELGALADLAAGSRWSGGVRELRNVLERYFLLRDRATATDDTWRLCCALSNVELRSAAPALEPFPGGTAGDMLRDLEELVFLHLAHEATGVRDLAERLGRTPQAVYDKLKKLGIGPDALHGDKLTALLGQVRGTLTPYQRWLQALLTAA
ncbi:MAG TPA: sigma 54-interacting transcriptional regulator [Kofleriaceae bacterium]